MYIDNFDNYMKWVYKVNSYYLNGLFHEFWTATAVILHILNLELNKQTEAPLGDTV